jgi:hypothetical protein
MNHSGRISSIGIALVLLATACGNGTAATGSHQPPAGTISGMVVGYKSADKLATKPVSGVTVEVFTKAFPFIGPVMLHQPKAIARTTSDGGGRFRLSGLEPGRYFVLFGRATSRWVRLTPGHGARVTAAMCQDCPLPM